MSRLRQEELVAENPGLLTVVGASFSAIFGLYLCQLLLGAISAQPSVDVLPEEGPMGLLRDGSFLLLETANHARDKYLRNLSRSSLMLLLGQAVLIFARYFLTQCLAQKYFVGRARVGSLVWYLGMSVAQMLLTLGTLVGAGALVFLLLERAQGTLPLQTAFALALCVGVTLLCIGFWSMLADLGKLSLFLPSSDRSRVRSVRSALLRSWPRLLGARAARALITLGSALAVVALNLPETAPTNLQAFLGFLLSQGLLLLAVVVEATWLAYAQTTLRVK